MSQVYVEFVGGPIDGTVQRWPEGRPPGREIVAPPDPGPEPAGRATPSAPRQAVYRRRCERAYGFSTAVKVLYDFEELR